MTLWPMARRGGVGAGRHGARLRRGLQQAHILPRPAQHADGRPLAHRDRGGRRDHQFALLLVGAEPAGGRGAGSGAGRNG
jgi:hypothetical protein